MDERRSGRSAFPEPRRSILRRDTVLDLSDLVGDRIDPAAFFAENHVTEGMRTLLTEGFRRLEGRSTQGVFKLFYQILRTRLLESLPHDAEVEAVAQGYAKAVREAKQMDVTNASPEQFASRVVESTNNGRLHVRNVQAGRNGGRRSSFPRHGSEG